MPYVSVEVEMNDIDTDDLIEEIESRGYSVFTKNGDEEKNLVTLTEDMEEVIWRYKTGYIEDAMILLERSFPELYGISKLIRS
jgi:hypothetical protein